MRGIFSALAFAVAAIGGGACCHAGSMVLYDDFSAKLIDPAKWFGAYGDTAMLESSRQIVGGRLHLNMRAYADTDAEGGGRGGVWGLGFPLPDAVTAVSFPVTVNAAAVVPCSSDRSAETVTGPDFRGHFFNDRGSPTDQTGDIEAVLGASRSPGSRLLNAFGLYDECTNPECTNPTILDYQILGKIAVGTTNTLSLTWDQPNHRFLFALNGAVVPESYTISDTTPAFLPVKTLGVSRVVPNCTSTPRPTTFIDVDIGRVSVNPPPSR